jgi:hypothetical protein
LITFIFLTLTVLANECQTTQDPSQLPCNVITSWFYPQGCSNYSVNVYNSSAEIINYSILSSYGITGLCQFVFNQTKVGTYTYNISSGDTGSLLVQGDNMWLAAILLIPLGLCFFFIYLSNSFSEEHEPLKWFFRLFALFSIFSVYLVSHIIINLNPIYIGLLDVFNFFILGWIFWLVLAIFLVYLIYKIFMSFKHRKEHEFDTGFIR